MRWVAVRRTGSNWRWWDLRTAEGRTVLRLPRFRPSARR